MLTHPVTASQIMLTRPFAPQLTAQGCLVERQHRARVYRDGCWFSPPMDYVTLSCPRDIFA